MPHALNKQDASKYFIANAVLNNACSSDIKNPEMHTVQTYKIPRTLLSVYALLEVTCIHVKKFMVLYPHMMSVNQRGLF